MSAMEFWLEMVTDKDRDYMYSMYAAESRARINIGFAAVSLRCSKTILTALS